MTSESLVGTPRTKVLLIGGTGFLGRHVLNRLSTAGMEVTVVTRRPAALSAGCRVVELDGSAPRRAQFASMINRFTPDAVVNTVGEIWRNDASLLQAANAELPEQLALAMADLGSTARLVHLGSSLEYGPLPRPHATDEGCPEAPRSEYGRTKLRGTRRIFEVAREASLDIVVLRIFNAIGSNMSPVSLLGRTLQTLTRARRDGHPARLTLFDLSQHRDYADARDVAEAVLRSTVSRRLSGVPVLNIGTGRAASAYELVRGLALASGVEFAIDVLPAPEGGGRSLAAGWQIADPTLARRHLDWSAARTLPETLRWIWRTAGEGQAQPIAGCPAEGTR
ncbi:NAD(P)-dependent oxidoreductase [Streptomyces sp. NBC_00878]|uniref:NAD-dependent epimerase/dehydratase family protein n=1 Tax=Streptomyces sp. NBC_00878 TaxID=2975854 RepID=UPI0022599F61|nr:NAD(P)-dependent oxidoreductase [Streptomyces sp. NBC_00878]MCX4904311.1 NAD(P)-dependent oxidoreductase [Streptomyces sp. NBC_00878]